MLDISMQFLEDISINQEELLKPTLFMQSTHNTISSAIAIRNKCYGYNTTYSQGEDSMLWAMRDAERLIATGKAATVLVIEFDESSPILAKAAEYLNVEPPKELYSRSIVLKRK
jgi:3-oxoacyl-(acyl-carrier-protein) synthase